MSWCDPKSRATSAPSAERLASTIPKTWTAARAACLIATIAAGIQGCAIITTYTPEGEKERRTIEEFRAYAERVFRKQNALGDEIIFLQEDLEQTDAARYELVLEAERRMLDACALLNEVASRMREDEKISMRKGRKIAKSVPECEAATDDAQTVVRSIEREMEQGG